MPSQEVPHFTERSAASVTLGGLLAVSLLAALTQPATTRAAMRQTGPGSAVRVVGAPILKERGCAEQAWPYVEPRCLARDAKNSAPSENAMPTPSERRTPAVSASDPVPPGPATQVVTATPNAAVAELPAPAGSPPSAEPKPIAGDSSSRSLVAPADASEGTGRPAAVLPAPPGAEPRPAKELPIQTPSRAPSAAPVNRAVATAPVMATLIEPDQTARQRTERRRRALRRSRSYGLFGFRVVGGRF
jgi:hypothetical protein